MSDRVLEARRDERCRGCRAQIDQQPGCAVLDGVDHRRENIFFLQAGARQGLLLRVFLDDVDHFGDRDTADQARSEEHTSELQSLMRSSYAVFCLKKKIYT